MSAIPGIGLLALAVGAFATIPAAAQAPSPAKSAAAEAVAVTTTPAGRWACMAGASLEIAPVSFDTFGEATAWVLVHRVKNEIVASERIDSRQIEELRRMRCEKPGGDSKSLALVG